MPRERLVTRAEERLAELVDDARAAQLRERVVGGPRSDEGTVRERFARPVNARDDDLEPRARASAISSTPVTPQSTARDAPQPSSASRASVCAATP